MAGLERKGQCKVVFYPDLDEEIDYIHSVIEKQEVTDIKPPKQPKHPAAKADVTKSETDASELQEAGRGRLLPQSHNATAPAPAVPALPNTPTPQPRATAVRVRGGPIAVPASKIMISVCVVLGTVAVILATVCYVNNKPEPKVPDSEVTSDEEEVGGDFTVYECPGLAPPSLQSAISLAGFLLHDNYSPKSMAQNNAAMVGV
ncbi:hypothetical protein EYF80_019025 [Liparis tanakae]|uniref:Uncharacterized protein n=1 Tax=Liparis tanakae TaxID=230148 RepID=A0A4Z2I0H7_9TELE|nr:hypothetical protein EYF80_019025 [Liparis tanakae]